MVFKRLFLMVLLVSTVRSRISLPKQQAVDILKSLETGETVAFSAINPNKYIQHNLDAPNGLAGIKDFQAAGLGTTTVNTLRVFQDGDFVFAHTNYTFKGAATTGFDVWRLERGLFVEHWDNLQANPLTPNYADRTMLDGPTQSKDPNKTLQNKALVANYAHSLVNQPWDSRSLADNLIQHNPVLGDGVTSLIQGWKTWASNGAAVQYTSIFKVLGEGDFVLVLAQGTLGNNPVAFYDLYRVDNGKIVEHWDSVQAIPSPYQWRNSNGKF